MRDGLACGGSIAIDPSSICKPFGLEQGPTRNCSVGEEKFGKNNNINNNR